LAAIESIGDRLREKTAFGAIGDLSIRAGVIMSCSERCKEIKRRRHRRRKLEHFKKRLAKATVSEKAQIAAKIRDLTPGADSIIDRLSLEER
jgi:hypothetical protein